MFNVLLQVLDDGRLTDGQGRTVDFTNTIIILTSNLGSQYPVEPRRRPEGRGRRAAGDGGGPRPFPARIPQPARRDHPVPPARPGAYGADRRHPGRRASRQLLKDRKIALELTDAARAWLGRVGYDPVYGARPLKRAVQKYLQDPLADAHPARRDPGRPDGQGRRGRRRAEAGGGLRVRCVIRRKSGPAPIYPGVATSNATVSRSPRSNGVVPCHIVDGNRTRRPGLGSIRRDRRQAEIEIA